MSRTRVIVHNYEGEGVLTLNGVEHPVIYKLRYEADANTHSTIGYLSGLPYSAIEPHPQDDRIPLTLHTGQTVGIAIFGGDPCRIRVNTPMPGLG